MKGIISEMMPRTPRRAMKLFVISAHAPPADAVIRLSICIAPRIVHSPRPK
jgi:hypothetical protein